MINHLRFIWQQLIASSVTILAGILLIIYVPVILPISHFLIMVAVLTLITILSYLLMARGIEKSDKDGLVFLLGGIGMKFILYLLFILIYWAFTKNLSKPFIIAFFLLYLTFTFLMVISLFKLLKAK